MGGIAIAKALSKKDDHKAGKSKKKKKSKKSKKIVNNNTTNNYGAPQAAQAPQATQQAPPLNPYRPAGPSLNIAMAIHSGPAGNGPGMANCAGANAGLGGFLGQFGDNSFLSNPGCSGNFAQANAGMMNPSVLL